MNPSAAASSFVFFFVFEDLKEYNWRHLDKLEARGGYSGEQMSCGEVLFICLFLPHLHSHKSLM